MQLLLRELVDEDDRVPPRVVAELRHEQRGVHRLRLALGEAVGLVVAAPWVGRLVRRLVQDQRVDRVAVGVRVDAQRQVRIRADRQAEMGRKVCDLAEQACIEKDQVAPIADPQIAVAAGGRHEKARPAGQPVVHARDGIDRSPIERKEQQVLEARR